MNENRVKFIFRISKTGSSISLIIEYKSDYTISLIPFNTFFLCLVYFSQSVVLYTFFNQNNLKKKIC